MSFSLRRVKSPETSQRAFDDLKKVMGAAGTQVKTKTHENGQTYITLTGEDGRVHTLQLSVEGKKVRTIFVGRKPPLQSPNDPVKRRFRHLSAVK